MLARYILLMLLCELAAYAAITEWLHFLYGWQRPMLVAGAVAIALGSRLLMVCITTALGYKLGATPAPGHRMGFAGYAALIMREWSVVLRNNFYRLPFARWSVRRDPATGTGARMPVVLVHGYFCNRGLWSHVVPRLERRGVGPLFVPSFSSAFASIEHFAGELEAEIDRIAAATGQPRVILVCHSMGGLAARLYLCKRGADHVARLVTIASPHNGTVHALLGTGENARQMQRQSAFLKALCAKEEGRGPACPVTSIYTPHDNLVAPQDTSILPWAKNIALPGLGHLDILGSRALEEVLLEELRSAGVQVK
jgi:triacylglycerol esterase/lipase EstA (alpha/beta hydrolase family)